MEEARSIEVMEVLVCASGVAYGLLLAYGLKEQWRWITDPPEWTSVIYFPTVIKMIWGPKHVRSFAYLTAYGALVMSLICLVQSVVGSFYPHYSRRLLLQPLIRRYDKPDGGGLAAQSVNILFQVCLPLHGSARPSRVASRRFRHEVS